MKNTIERLIYNKMESKDFGESMCNETKLKVLRWTIQQLKQHGVMQAEASASAEGAAVGNSAAGQSVSGGCYHQYEQSLDEVICVKCGKHYID